LESKQYIFNGKAGNSSSISDSSKRLKLLQQTIELQDTFFEKFHEYRVQKIIDPGSLQTRQLFAECKVLKEESEQLLKQV